MEDSYVVLLVEHQSAGSIDGELIPSIIVMWTNQTLPVNQSDVHHISLSHWFYKGSGTKTSSSPLHPCSPPQFPRLLPLPLWMGRTQLAGRWRERRRIALRSNWSPPRKKWREKGSRPGLSRYGDWFTYWYHWNQQSHGQHFLSVLTFLVLSLYSVVVDICHRHTGQVMELICGERNSWS